METAVLVLLSVTITSWRPRDSGFSLNISTILAKVLSSLVIVLTSLKNPGSSVVVVVSNIFATDVDMVDIITGAKVVVAVSKVNNAVKVGDVESGVRVVVVVASDATEEIIEPKVRVSNRKAIVYCDLHRK